MARLRGKLFGDRGGNTALMFALLAPVLIVLSGGIVDITQASIREATLQQAADSAAVAAVARTSPGYTYAVNQMNSNGPVPDSVTSKGVQALFNANWTGVKDTTIPTVQGGSCGGSTLVCKQASALSKVSVSSIITATATYTPNFLGLIGIKTIPLKVTAQASDNVPAYMDFYLLLDNTPSMGLGATTTDIANMESANGCAFACHTTNDPGENYYAKAKSLGITMRIDVVRQATQDLMQTATTTESSNGIPNEFRMAIYDFGQYAYNTPALNPVSSLTTNLLTQSQTDAATVDLEQVPSNNYAYASAVAQGQVNNNDQDTSFDTLFPAIGNVMVPSGTAGTGVSAGAPQKILFVVTDGMVDQNNGGRQMGGINAATCTALKNKGIIIAILYTTYWPASISNDPWSVSNALPLLPQIAPALTQCASVGPEGPLYYQVSPTQGISQAMQALFETVVASVRITG